jgi:hypothetical protein
MIATMGSKPSDVSMPGAFTTALPELQQSVSTSDIPASVLSSLAELPEVATGKSFSDTITNVDSTLFDSVIGQSPLGNEQVLDELMGKVREQMGPFVSGAANEVMNTMRKEAGKGSRKDMENQIKARNEGKVPLGMKPEGDLKRPIERAERVEPRVEPETQKDTPAPKVAAQPQPAAQPKADVAPTPASKPPPQAFEEVTIPGPEIIKLERSLGAAFEGIDLNGVDIEALLQIVMLACAKESATDLRSVLKEVQANNERKKANREQVSEIKEQRASMLGALRKDYDQRCSLPEGNDLYIDSSRMIFDEFCKAQPLRLLKGDPRAVDNNGDFAGGLAFAVSPNTFYQSKQAREVLDARGNVISPSLVLQAERLKLQPQALQSLLDAWNGDPKLRAAHASFEAFLVGPQAQGGLGLAVGATAAQDTKVAAFLVAHQSQIEEAQKKRAEQPPVNAPTGNTVSLRAISSEARALQSEFPVLKEEDLRALEAFWEAAPGPKGASFTSWAKGTDVGSLPSPTLVMNGATSPSAFFASIASGTTQAGAVSAANAAVVTDNAEALLGRAQGTWPDYFTAEGAYKNHVVSLTSDIGAYAAKYLAPPVTPGTESELTAKRNSLDDALKAYFVALVAVAWQKRDNRGGDSAKAACESAFEDARRTLDEKMGAFGDPGKKYAANYVKLRLIVVEKVSAKMGEKNWAHDDVHWQFDKHGETFFASAFVHKSVPPCTAKMAHLSIPEGGTEWLSGNDLRKVSGQTIIARNSFQLAAVPPKAATPPAWSTNASLKEIASKYPAAYRAPQAPAAPANPAPTASTTVTAAPVTAAMAAAIANLNAAPEAARQPANDASLRQMSLADVDALIEKLQSKGDTIGDLGEELSLKLQMYQERRSKFFETLSNMMKKMADTSGGMIANLK